MTETTFWTIYVPIIIALISVYINNSGDMYDLRISQINKSIMDLHELKDVDIYGTYQKIIKKKNQNRFDYQDVYELQQSLITDFYRLYYTLDKLRLNIGHIRMRARQSDLAWYYVKSIVSCVHQSYVFTYEIWGEIENDLRHAPDGKRNDGTYISRVINNEFINTDPKSPESMQDVMVPLKQFTDELYSLKHVLEPMSDKWLITYEFERAFLGRELVKRHHVSYF